MWKGKADLGAIAALGCAALLACACRERQRTEPPQVRVEAASGTRDETGPELVADAPLPAGTALRDKILGVNAHVIVLKYSVDFSEYRSVIDQVRGVAGVAAVAPFTLGPMTLAARRGTAEVIVKGVDPELMPAVLDLPKHIVEGSLAGLRLPGAQPPHTLALGDAGTGAHPCDGATAATQVPGVVLGRTLARRLGLGIGACAELTDHDEQFRLGPATTLPFRVIALFDVGFDEYDSKLAYVDLRAWQALAGRGDSVTGVELRVEYVERAGEIAQRIRTALGDGPYKTLDWRELNPGLFGPDPAASAPPPGAVSAAP
ncbi:MAG: ABC transporter permease [Myxococcales bacterium]|nr:ABC transporter permease [Myxococcales bacterium]